MSDLSGALVAVVVCLLLIVRTIGPFTLLNKFRKNGLITIEHKESVKFWAPFLLIGPIPLAIIALCDIVFGQLVYYAYRAESCADLRSSLIASVVLSYVFVMVWSWAYVGERVEFTLPNFRKNKEAKPIILVICRPYAQLGELAVFFLDCALWSVLVMASLTMNLTSECISQSTRAFAVLLAMAYWWSFCCVLYSALRHAVSCFKRRPREKGPYDEAAVADRFELVGGSRTEVPSKDFGGLLDELGLILPPEELTATAETLDDDGAIEFRLFWDWYSLYITQNNEGTTKDKPKRGIFGRKASKKKNAKILAAPSPPSSEAEDEHETKT